MPLVSPVAVVSFSSEDPNNPASNLLSRDTFRKWRCKEEGEREAFVILKFSQAVQFTAIDVGNECSAMLEILVGRSGGDPANVKYEVLVSSSVLMSPTDCRTLQNPNGVRNYTVSSFDRETASQKWDLVKIVVSQIFNNHTQFGLTFVKFMAVGEGLVEEKPKTIGGFALKKRAEESESEEELGDFEPRRIGALFAQTIASKKSNGGSEKANSTTTPVSREIEVTPGGSRPSSEKGLNKEKEKSSSKRAEEKAGPSAPLGSSINSNSRVSSPSISAKQQAPTLSSSGWQRQGTSSSPLSRPPSKKSNQDKSVAVKKKRKLRKPFDKLFQGVVFVMSGFENPLRKNLRDKAIEMGAKAKPDWDSSCTHLICAFINTPKFREVRAARNNGKIVRKDWIERSYEARRRFPWRRFCLDRDDKGAESEEEILADSESEEEEIQGDSSSNGNSGPEASKGGQNDGNNGRKRSLENENSNDGVGKVKKRKRILVLDEDDDEEGEEDEEKEPRKVDIYEDDTDVDEPEDDNMPQFQSAKKIPTEEDSDTDFDDEENDPTAGYFQNLVFFLSWPNGDLDEKGRIEQIITRRKGKVEQELTEAVELLVTGETEWHEDFSEALSDNPNLSIVNLKWVEECEKQGKKVPVEDFIISPL